MFPLSDKVSRIENLAHFKGLTKVYICIYQKVFFLFCFFRILILLTQENGGSEPDVYKNGWDFSVAE